jgi:hypothetical protein
MPRHARSSRRAGYDRPMWQLRADLGELARAWRAAEPFPHVVIDDVVAPGELEALLAVLDDEGVAAYEGDLFAFDATAPEPATQGMRELRAQFGAELAPALAQVTGKHVARADLRAYAYRVGHYLLPHTDHREGLERVLAYAYYLPTPEPPRGGELELFACEPGSDGDGELAAIASARVIEPRANRLVVFDVSDVTLHQVREVVGGLRLSLAGWFYA